MLQLFLFLHVMGAIITFGPSFIFPILATRAQKEPQHAHFVAETTHFISSRLVFPGAIIQGVTGVGLILILGADLTSPSYRWLLSGIVLYLIAIAYSALVQTPAATRMVELTAGAGRPAGGPPAGGAPAGGAPAGPPPELVATGRKPARGGAFLSLLVVVIVILMVVKPGY